MLLEIPQDADKDLIKSKYRKLFIKIHPDNNPKHTQEATRLTQLLNAAVQILSNPLKRAALDSFLASYEEKPPELTREEQDQKEREAARAADREYVLNTTPEERAQRRLQLEEFNQVIDKGFTKLNEFLQRTRPFWIVPTTFDSGEDTAETFSKLGFKYIQRINNDFYITLPPKNERGYTDMIKDTYDATGHVIKLKSKSLFLVKVTRDGTTLSHIS